ncbi:MAG TPA: signal peptidase II [Streptosporangiaceae bacterium]|nr:signal peptidase II [Streptosporangiaceae bacterium]
MITADERGAARRRVIVLIGVAATVLAADIASKAAIVAALSPQSHVRLLGGTLTLAIYRNPGAAFGIGGPPVTILFTAIAAGVAAFIVRYSRRIASTPWAVTLGLLLGGAVGNLTDRLFRSSGLLQGWVVDWIKLPHWPTFNIADSAISCGAVLAVLLAARGTAILDRRSDRGSPAPSSGAAG